MRLLDEVVEIAFPVLSKLLKNISRPPLTKGPVGEVNRAHAPQIPIRRDNPDDEAQTEAGPNQRHAQNAGLTRTTLPMWFWATRSSS
jgi:hypothetical protein